MPHPWPGTVATGISYPPMVERAWAKYGDPRSIQHILEISANVSTNRVYRLTLNDGHEVIAKTSSYGSYVHFRQDHRIIQEWFRQLNGTRFRHFLAPMLLKDREPFTHREGNAWVVFYKKAPFYDFLPKVLTPTQVQSLGREMAALHKVSTDAARELTPSWKSLGSDIASLFDALGMEDWREERGFDASIEDTLRKQCELFLTNAERLGYHQFPKIPVLMDWNTGNFSVGFEADGFHLFSRWDYDWFRVEPRTLDFYFCARVVRAEGDQSVFSYTAEPFFEPAFFAFLKAYHHVNPLAAEEVLFLKEAYRAFLLIYVMRMGEHFFREEICRRLHHEALTHYFPRLDALDFEPLLQCIAPSRLH